MERNPFRLVWRTSPALHVAAVLLLCLGAVVLYLGLDLLRVVIDAVAAAPRNDSHEPHSVLRLTLPVPSRISAEPLVLFAGFNLDVTRHWATAVAALVSVSAILALIRVIVGLFATWIGARTAARLRRRIIDRILHARPSARGEIEDATALISDRLSRDSGPLGSTVITPLAAGGAVALALLTMLGVDLWIGASALGGLILYAAAMHGYVGAQDKAVMTRQREGGAIGQELSGLMRRLSALHAHGTIDYERDRFGRHVTGRHQPVQKADRRVAIFGSVAAFTAALPTVAVLGVGAWLASHAALPVGSLTEGVAAAMLATFAVRGLVRWQRSSLRLRPLLEEITRVSGSLQAKERKAGRASLPAFGALTAQGISAYDPDSGTRISGVDFSIALPAHVAIVGDVNTGPRVLAALLGGQLDPSVGRLTLGGVDLAATHSADRARRLAFAGGDTVIIPGSLRQNLLYGCADPETPELDHRLFEAITAAGLDRFIHARGLAGKFDPRREPKLAALLVDTRRAVRAALAAEGLDRFVDPFDPARYNHHATVGENILFGAPVGDTFHEEHLASHPFVRAILEAEGLTKPFIAMGLTIASSMVEIFSDIPDGHPLFDRFAFFSAAERGYFEDLVERRSERRRGPESGRDRERLISLALRYNESRHRLGLLDEDLVERLVTARQAFRHMLPTSLQPAIEFYDPDRLCSAASVQDNLLFGRIAHDQAGAEAQVHELIRRVLTERGLDSEISRIGLSAPLDRHAEELTPSEIAAIDLVRCLVRRADTVIVERILDGLPTAQAEALVERLRRALVGRGLILVTGAMSPRMDTPPFDYVMQFERGGLVDVAQRGSVAAPEPALV